MFAVNSPAASSQAPLANLLQLMSAGTEMELLGGFFGYTHKLARGARIQYGKKLVFINFQKRRLGFEDGTQTTCDKLVSTLPLPILIRCAEDAPDDVREAASLLKARVCCSSGWRRITRRVRKDHNSRPALERINRFLESNGVIRAGRYSQWGYMMTHDCVLRGKKVAEHLTTRSEALTEFEIDD